MAAYSFSARSTSAVTYSDSNNKPPSPAVPPRHPEQPERTYPLGLTHSIPNPIPNPYPCPHCDKCFQSPRALSGHQNFHRRRIPTPISDDEVVLQPPIRIQGRQTYENRLNYLMNPNPGNGNVGPYEPTDEEKFNMWCNAPCYYFYKYHVNNEIDYNTSRYFKNSYLRKNNIRPTGSSITAESNNGGKRNKDYEANEVSSKPIVMIDLTRSP